MLKRNQRLIASRLLAYAMLTLAYTLILCASRMMDTGDMLRVVVFSTVVAVITISGIAMWTIPIIDINTKERIEKLMEDEEE